MEKEEMEFKFEGLTFLEEGEYTKKTDVVEKITKEITKELKPTETKETLLQEISNYVKDLKYVGHKSEIFRKRTASEILESGLVTGCTDTALCFIVLARTLGIPTRYVETFNKEWLEDVKKDLNNIQAHVFVDILGDTQWKAYETKRGFTKDNKYTMSGRDYIVIGKGLDFTSVYIKENGGYRKKPLNLQSIDEQKKIIKLYDKKVLT